MQLWLTQRERERRKNAYLNRLGVTVIHDPELNFKAKDIKGPTGTTASLAREGVYMRLGPQLLGCHQGVFLMDLQAGPIVNQAESGNCM